MSSPQPDTRERILQETWQLMEKGRGQAVRVEDIAKAAGVSRQAVYMHFGSRGGLLIATARYVDEVLKINERLQPVFFPQGGIETLNAYITFWTSYLPDIYGLAKAFINARETDEAAAAAWDDRMKVFYDGCQTVIGCLQKDNVLAPEWTVEDATDFLGMVLSVTNWENLTVERGWSQEHYAQRIRQMLKQTLVREDPL